MGPYPHPGAGYGGGPEINEPGHLSHEGGGVHSRAAWGTDEPERINKLDRTKEAYGEEEGLSERREWVCERNKGRGMEGVSTLSDKVVVFTVELLED